MSIKNTYNLNKDNLTVKLNEYIESLPNVSTLKIILIFLRHS